MAAAQLPPLLRLALGSPTGMMEDDADSDTEHAHERLDQRAHRKFPTLMPKPLVQGLATLPSEMVGMIVTAAAMSARETTHSARTMCEWMKAFCRAAGNQGQKCQDVWYWHALAAFGLSTERSDAEGVEPTLPDRSGFGSWRALFGGLCEAIYGSRPHGRDDIFHVWRYETYRYYAPQGHRYFDVDGFDGKQYLQMRLNLKMTQRELDTMLVQLLDAKANWDVLTRAAGRVRSAVEMAGGHTVRERITLQAQQQSREWDEWFANRASPLRDDTSPWMAVVTLVTLLGARTADLKAYSDADMDFYNAVNNLFNASYISLTRYEIRDPQALERAMEAMRDARVRGADVNELRKHLALNNVLTMAIKLRNEELLSYLLDCGVRQEERVHEFFDVAKFHSFYYASMPWIFSRKTTEKLIDAMRYLIHAATNDPMIMSGLPRWHLELRRDLESVDRGELGGAWVPEWLPGMWATLLPADV